MMLPVRSIGQQMGINETSFECMKVLILEENEGARNALTFYLRQLTQVKEIIEIVNYQQGHEYLKENQVDLVFASERVEGVSIYNLLDQVDYHSFELVIVAKDSTHMHKASSYGPKAFLIKPVSKAELEAIVEEVSSGENKDYGISFVSLKELQNDSLLVRVARGFTLINLNEILNIISFGAYSKFFLVNGSMLLVNGSLSSFEVKLAAKGFVRIHTSTVVNLQHVRSFTKEKNDGKLVMQTGEEFRVSRTKKNNLDLLRFFELKE